MSEATLNIHTDDSGLGTITLNRPDIHNAFDDRLIKDITAALKSLEQNQAVKVVALRAAGKSFSAGADLNWMRRMADYSWDENYQDSLVLATLMQTLHGLSKPTVGVVQGAAFGGGVGLVACCDIVVASEKATFCLSEVKLGLIPAVISPYVVAAIGERQAHRYFLTAERFDAKAAQQMGLVHQLAAADELDQTADTIIQAILNNGPEAVKAAKQLIRLVAHHELNEELVRETAQRIADIRASKQGKEGVSAFLEKRAPLWQSNQDG